LLGFDFGQRATPLGSVFVGYDPLLFAKRSNAWRPSDRLQFVEKRD
jgi:hypothetical protein